MKTYSLEEMTDKHIGKKGTKERDEFDYELRLGLLGHSLKQARKERNLTQDQHGKLVGVKKAQKLLIVLILLTMCTGMTAQSEIKIFARLHSVEINSVLYQSNPVRTTIFTAEKLSEITEFGRIDDVIFGIRVEVHESRINPEISHIIRRNFYFKKKGDLSWRKINSDMNTYDIPDSSFVVDFAEIDQKGNHNSFQTTSRIDGDYVSFKITYDCVYQWK